MPAACYLLTALVVGRAKFSGNMKTRAVGKLGMRLLASALCLLCSVDAAALEDGQLVSVGGLTYRVDDYSRWDGSGAVTLAGYGADMPCDVVIPAEVRYFDHDDGREYVFAVWGVAPYAFQGCGELASVDVRTENPLEIGSCAFGGCTNLKSAGGLDGAVVGDHAFSGCTSLTVVEGMLNSIGAYAFENCSSLEAVPQYGESGFSEIPEGAYSGCTSLEEVRIDKPIVWIYADAFKGCTGLRTVEFPYTLQTIYENAFAGCTDLTDIYVYGTSQPSLAGGVFSEETFSRATVHVPDPVAYAYGGGMYEGWFRFKHVEKLAHGSDLAYDLELDGVYYILRVKSRELIKIGNDEIIKTYYDAYVTQTGVPSYVGGIVIPEVLADEAKTYIRTVGVGDYAFWGCAGLDNVVIPNSVTGIGRGAFGNCSGLSSVILSDATVSIGGNAFAGCTSLAHIDIPNSVTDIFDGAFSGCTGLTGIVIPNSVTFFGAAFGGCTGLESVVLPNSITEIAGYAFDGCSSLGEINIPGSVAYIGECAFRGCTGLAEVVMPNTVASLGNLVFSDCSGLRAVTLPDAIKKIPNGCFSGCSSLTDVDIPSSVTRIEGTAFYGCSSLTEITIPESVTQIGVVGNATFGGCTGLKEIVIPNSVVTLASQAFGGCTGLERVTLSENLTEIEGYMFYNCPSLREITIPAAVAAVGDKAFQGCTALAAVNVENPEPPTAFYTTFTEGQYADAVVVVPEGSLDRYESADPWLNFKWLRDGQGTGISSTEGQGAPACITVDGGRLVVVNACGRVTVYGVSGEVVESVDADGRVELDLPAGVYVVETAGATVKIAV